MIRIGIDARLITQTGVGTYIKNFLYSLKKLTKDDDEMIFFVFLLEKDLQRFNFPKNFTKVKANYRWHSFQEQLGFLHLLNMYNLDLMHFTYFSYPFLYRRRFIITFHDLTPLILKTGKASTKNVLIYNLKYLVFKMVLSKGAKNSKKIIVPSHTVKNQVLNTFKDLDAQKLEVIYEGVDKDLIRVSENVKLKNKFPNFFFYLGNFYPHKNLEFLIDSFVKTEIPAQLVLVGPDDFFSVRLKKKVRELGDKRIKFYTPCSLSDIKFFYKNALALIHPSLSEGFGLTLLEALYFKCPVLASNISVFKELYSDNYIPFNPENKDGLSDLIEDFYFKKASLPKKEINWNDFSFLTLSKRILSLYKEVLTM